MRKKLLSIILLVAVALTMMPAMAMTSFAADSGVQAQQVILLQAKTSGSKAVSLSWTKADTATKYIVYGNKCGKSLKKLKTTTGTSYKVTKINKKVLKAHKSYRFKVVAYSGSRKLVASKSIHFITGTTMGKYANAKSISVSPKSLSLKQGKKATLKTITKIYKNKKHISKSHGAAARYISDNPEVAAVNSKGVVTAKSSGRAKIYIQDNSGKYCSAAVTVMNADGNEFNMPEKGQLIKLSGFEKVYRVLKVDGTQAELLDMSGENIAFNSECIRTDFGNGNSLLQYSGSTLDKYLNETYFKRLPENIQNAIQEKDIEQRAYTWNISVKQGEPTYWEGIDRGQNKYYLIYRGLSTKVGPRKVYAPDVKDVIDYVGKDNIKSKNISEMFFDMDDLEREHCCWLRSANTSFYNGAMYAQGLEGKIYFQQYGWTLQARAMFNIDLSQCGYEEIIMPEKGDLITLDNQDTQYRVIGVDGVRAELLDMNSVNTPFDADGTTTVMRDGDDETTRLQYKNSDLDKYLNESYYSGLTQNIKNAIVPKNITQHVYDGRDKKPEGNAFWEATCGFGKEQSYYLTQERWSERVGKRNIYVLDMEDVLQYLGKGNITAGKLNEMFFNTANSVNKSSWLRSALTINNEYASCVYGKMGAFNGLPCKDVLGAQAAFTIDLGRCSWACK